jgi:putative heme-binding domain-containing protein
VAAIRALGGYSQKEISEEMIARWADSTPAVRNEAMQVLLRRTSFTLSLLKAVEKKIIAADEIPPSRLTYLRGHRNSEVKGLALKVLGRKSNAAREKIITTFLPAIRLEGKIKPGQEIFVTRCATCHRLNGQGFELGPDLETTRRWSKAELLTHVIDPNSKVEPAQKIYQITTRTDEDYAGLIVAESANSITLGQPQGIKTTILRANIRKMKSLGVSMMPEGLEAGLALQDMADLLSYLKNEK